MEKKINQIKDSLKDFPADVNAYILLTTLRDILAQAHASLLMASDIQGELVCRQVKMIADMSAAIIEMINVKKVEIKN